LGEGFAKSKKPLAHQKVKRARRGLAAGPGNAEPSYCLCVRGQPCFAIGLEITKAGLRHEVGGPFVKFQEPSDKLARLSLRNYATIGHRQGMGEIGEPEPCKKLALCFQLVGECGLDQAR
jgi:hypothetical protein